MSDVVPLAVRVRRAARLSGVSVLACHGARTERPLADGLLQARCLSHNRVRAAVSEAHLSAIVPEASCICSATLCGRVGVLASLHAGRREHDIERAHALQSTAVCIESRARVDAEQGAAIPHAFTVGVAGLRGRVAEDALLHARRTTASRVPVAGAVCCASCLGADVHATLRASARGGIPLAHGLRTAIHGARVEAARLLALCG